MEKKQNSPARGGTGKYLIALLFILSGVLLLARNMGWIDREMFNTIVSWQMLLIVWGVYKISIRRYFVGTILITVGGIFLLSRLGLWAFLPVGALTWPVALIAVGFTFLFRHRGEDDWKFRMPGSVSSTTNQYNSADGFFHSENRFSGVRQVVLDEVFKGGTIQNSFGGTTIDLRRTTLAEGETFLDIDCTFGGIEIYAPSDWKIDLRCKAFFGGCEDKRFQSTVIDHSRVLVIRGDVLFGGVEIKS